MLGRGRLPAAKDNADAIERIEAELRGLMQAGDVGGARRLLARLCPGEQAHPRLARWARALRPPEVRIGAPGSTVTLERNAAWLREHAATYFGQWVALRDGELIGNHRDHVALHREIERRGELQGLLFVRIVDG